MTKVLLPRNERGNDPADHQDDPDTTARIIAEVKSATDKAKQESVHPYARYLDACTADVEAPEFVIDNVLIAGTVVLAGERGLGKTSVLVPMLAACTGLLNDYPLDASIRRKVIYVAEDTSQVRRIISAMRERGIITVGAGEFNDWFKLVEAKRMKAHEIAAVIPQYDNLYTPNKCVNGSIYMAPPVVVFDTTNATIDLENISDNAEVSGAVATLRQRFGAICLLLVGHVAKASRNDVKALSFVGAGSWEGDTQQALYLVNDNDERYLALGKRRFEPNVTEYRVVSHVCKLEAIDKLGHIVEIKCFYGVPEASSQAAKDEAKVRSDDAKKAAAWEGRKNRVIEYVGKNPGATKRNISESVSGNASHIREALESLIEDGEILVSEGAHNAGFHTLAKRDTDGHRR